MTDTSPVELQKQALRAQMSANLAHVVADSSNMSDTQLAAAANLTAALEYEAANPDDYIPATQSVAADPWALPQGLRTAKPTAPVVTSSLTASANNGTAFTYSTTYSGYADVWKATGLPAGLTINPTTGAISGTPNDTAGVFDVVITPANVGGPGESVTLVITLAGVKPVITSPLTLAIASGTAMSPYQITASGSPTTFAATGLPNGLSVNTGTGVISGTAAAPGVSNVSITATAGGVTSAAATLVITAS